MKFTINATTFKNKLESLQVKGKHLTNKGFSNSNFGTNVYASLQRNVLSLYNGDSIFLVKITVEVTAETEGEVSFDSSMLIPYLKSFKDEEIAFTADDFITVSIGNKKASIPKLVIIQIWKQYQRSRT